MRGVVWRSPGGASSQCGPGTEAPGLGCSTRGPRHSWRRRRSEGLVKSRRCIVPASGFYKWQQTPAGKMPLYIYRADGAPLALAGLYTFWRDPAKDEWVPRTRLSPAVQTGSWPPFTTACRSSLGEMHWSFGWTRPSLSWRMCFPSYNLPR